MSITVALALVGSNIVVGLLALAGGFTMGKLYGAQLILAYQRSKRETVH